MIRAAARCCLEQTGENSRPTKFAVSIRAQLGHELRDVHREFMGRRILAGVVTIAAIEAEVGEINQIALVKVRRISIAGKTAQYPSQ